MKKICRIIFLAYLCNPKTKQGTCEKNLQDNFSCVSLQSQNETGDSSLKEKYEVCFEMRTKKTNAADAVFTQNKIILKFVFVQDKAGKRRGRELPSGNDRPMMRSPTQYWTKRNYKQRVGGSTPSAPTTRKGKSKQNPEVLRLRDFLFIELFIKHKNASTENSDVSFSCQFDEKN